VLPTNDGRLVPGLAIAAYAAATFAAMWVTAHAYARDPFPDLATGVVGVFLAFVVFLLPLFAGFVIGRWWAVALVLCSFWQRASRTGLSHCNVIHPARSREASYSWR
jgi:hypothetical protein